MRLLAAILVLFALLTTSAEAGGIHWVELPGDGGGPGLVGAVWTPCARPDETVKLRRLVVPGVKGCPIEGEDLPLVVLSHGYRGWFGGHHDTAAALADAGYVAVAITHPDEGGRAWQTGRPATIKRLIDHMLTDWPDRARLDGSRIGFFGFSRGGYTGLVAIGGKPDFGLFVEHCKAVPDDFLCTVDTGKAAKQGRIRARAASSYTHDSRIKAAVITAPLGLVFSAEGLRNISVPVQLWRPEHDTIATYPYNAEAVYHALPERPDYRVVPNAGHFAIMAPCSPPMAAAVPRICTDPPGFDRIAFHKTFNADIVAFFDEHLTAR